MDKIKIGIPRALYYYYFKDIYKTFFEELGFEVVISPKTNYEILSLGNKHSVDEMCLSMKVLLGHVAYLEDKCDYLVVPRIDNYGADEQTCTNFLAMYDIIHSLFDYKLLHYNINLEKKEDEFRGFLRMGRALGLDELKVMKAYEKALDYQAVKQNKMIIQNQRKLRKKGIKILMVSHPYNTYDEMIGKPITRFLEDLGITLLYSDRFDTEITSFCSKQLSKDLYFKYSKENIGSIAYAEKEVDGVIFLSSFPCALDSISYELAMRRMQRPYLNIVIDDMNAGAGLETRLESFVDILEQKLYAG